MNETQEMLFVEEGDLDKRLDKLLFDRFGGVYSRTYFQKLIDEGLVLLNGEQVKKRTKPSIGDEIEVEFSFSVEETLKPEPIALSILYEDDDLLVVNKPAGLVVHPAPGNWTGTFANALLFHCKTLAVKEGDLRPGIVHRLDKDTSGVLLAAKNLQTQWKLIEAFAERKVYKEYVAITLGDPGNRTIDTIIGRDPKNRQKMAVTEKGKQARSIIKTLASNRDLALLSVVIETGRTHQIRVHLSSVGAPILGDSVYGRSAENKKYKCGRQLLHASKLRFQHPLTGKEIEVSAPLPEDFTFFLEQYRMVRLS